MYTCSTSTCISSITCTHVHTSTCIICITCTHLCTSTCTIRITCTHSTSTCVSCITCTHVVHQPVSSVSHVHTSIFIICTMCTDMGMLQLTYCTNTHVAGSAHPNAVAFTSSLYYMCINLYYL